MFLKNWTKGVVNSIKAMLTKKINISKFNFCPLILGALVLSLFLCLIVDRENRFDGYAQETPLFTNGVVIYSPTGSSNGDTCTAYNLNSAGTQKAYLYDDGMLILDGLYDSSSSTNTYTSTSLPWKDKTVDNIAISNNGYEPTNTAYLFSNYNGTTIYQIGKLNTSHVTNMDHMFNCCGELTELDLSSFNTSSVTTMCGMFSGCAKMTKVDLSGFTTTAVTDMSNMFESCFVLKELDLRNFSTTNLTNVSGMFKDCQQLTTIKFGDSFTAASVTNMSGMFNRCYVLAELNLSKFITSSVKDMSYMFNECNGLTKIILSNNFTVAKVTNMSKMFNGCSILATLNLSNFTTTNVENMSDMFNGCSALTELDLSKFVTTKVTTMQSMFGGCKSLTELDLSKFVTTKVTSMYGMFEDCYKLKNLDLSKFDTTSNTNMYHMFKSCNALTTLQVNIDDTKLSYYADMFKTCYNLKTLDLRGSTLSKNILPISTITSLTNIYLPTSVTGSAVNGISLPTTSGLVWMGYKSNKITEQKYTTLPVADETVDEIRLMEEPYLYKNSSGLKYYKDRTSGSYTLSNTYNLNSAGTQKAYLYNDGMLILDGIYDSSSSTNYFNNANELPWYGKTVDKIAISNNGYAPTNTKLLFANYTGKAIYQLEKLDTSHVENMESMFSGCRSLTQLDLSHFDTSNVTNIWCMFMDCISLTKLDLSSFNTTNVYTMSNAFWGCTGLTELNISNFSISSTTTYHDSLFQSCNKLNKIILPSSVDVTDIELPTVTGCVWFKYNEGTKVDNTKVTNLIAKSASYDNIRSVNVLYKDSTGVEYYPTGSSAGATCVAYDLTDTSKSLARSCMAYYYSDGMLIFDGAGATNTYTSYSLPWGNGGSGIQVNNIAISKNGFKPTSMSYLFSECKGTTIYQLEYLDTSNVTDMKYLFYKCRNLGSLNLSNFNTAQVTDMSHMFSQCNALTTLNVSSFDTSAVLYMNNMFDGCSALNNLSVSNFNTAKVKDMSCMFDSCEKLSSLVLSNFNTAQVTDMHSMFSGCKALTTLNVSSFNTAQVTDMQSMFSWCNALTSLNLSSFDTSAVTMMNGMFVRCDALGSLTLGSNFKTNNVTSMYQMFANCYTLNALNLSGFNTANVTNMYSIFMNNYALTELDLSKFEIKDLETLPPDLSTLSGLTKIKLPAYIKEGTTIDLPYSDDAIWLKYNDNSVANYTPVTKLITKSDDADSPYNYIKLVPKVLLYTDKNGTPDNTSDDILYYDVCTNKTTGDDKIDLVSVFDLIMPGKDDGNAKAYYYSDGMLIFDGYGTNDRYDNPKDRPWNGLTINAIAISNNGFKPKYLNYYFSGCSNITTIYQIEKLDTSNCIMMSHLFDGCTNLTNLDLSHFDTRNVTSMGYMFRNCKKLNNPHLVDSFVTSSLTSMYAMFQNYASEITTDNVILELPSTFTGKNITSSNQFIFSGFGSKTTGSVKIKFPDNFSIGSNVTGTNANKINLTGAFSSVGKNSEYVFIDFGDGFGGSQIMSIGSMFEDTNAKSISLKGIDLSNVDTSSATNYKDVFTGANRLDKIELPNSIVSDTLIDLPALDGYVWVKSQTYSPVDYTPITKLIAKSEGKYDCVTRISKDILYTDNMGTPDDISDDVIYYNVGTSDPSITLDKYDSDNDGVLDTTCVWNLSSVGNVKAYLYTDGLLILDGEGPLNLVKDNPNPNHDSHYAAKIYPWREYKKLENITKVVASQSRGFIPIDSIEGMFDFSVDYMGSETGYYTNLNPIPAFNISSAIESIDFSNFDTSQVTSMKNLFRNNQNCKNYHLENLNVSKVTDFTGMLSGIRANNNSDYANLYLNNWTLNNDTGVSIDMSNLFSGSKIEDLNMSGWSNTKNIANISNMFASTYFHKNIDLSMMQFTNDNLADSDNVKDVFKNLMFMSDGNTKIILPKEVGDDVIINLPSSSTDSWYGLDCNDTELGIDVRYTTLPERKGTDTGLLNKIKFRKDILYSIDGIEYYKNGTNKTVEPNKITLVKAYDITDTSKSQAGSCMAYLYSDGMLIYDGAGFNKNYNDYSSTDIFDKNDVTRIAISNYGFKPSSINKFVYAETYYYGWFNNMPNLTNVYQLDKFDTSNLLSLEAMFMNDSKLYEVIIPNSFDTSHINAMDHMFDNMGTNAENDITISLGEQFTAENCSNYNSMFAKIAYGNTNSNLKNITITFNGDFHPGKNLTDKVDLSGMFGGIYRHDTVNTASDAVNITIDLGDDFDASNVNNLGSMFATISENNKCVVNIDLGDNFNACNTTDCNSMFQDIGNGCLYNVTVDFGNNFNAIRCTSFKNLFYYGWGATKVNGSKLTVNFGNNFNGTTTSPCLVDNTMDHMFNDSAIDTVDLSKLDMTKTTNTLYMFAGSNISELEINNVATNITDTSYMFDQCKKLTKLKFGSNFNTSNVTTMKKMFEACEKLTTDNFDISHFDTKAVLDMADMFAGCKALTTLNLSHFDTKNVTTMLEMFLSCSKLTTLNISNFSTTNNCNTKKMFNGDKMLQTIVMPSTSGAIKTTDASSMFNSCQALTSLDVSSLDTTNCTDMKLMFSGVGSPSITFGNKFNTSNVTDMESMFDNCKVTSLTLPSTFTTSNVTRIAKMFQNMTNVESINLNNGIDLTNIVDTAGAATNGIDYLFYNTPELTSITSNNDKWLYNSSSITSAINAFNGTALSTIDLSDMDLSNLTNNNMLNSNSALTKVIIPSSVSTTQDNIPDLPGSKQFRLFNKDGSLVTGKDVQTKLSGYQDASKKGMYLSTAKPLTSAVATFPELTFNGLEQKPEFTLTFCGTTLVKDTDYEIVEDSWTNNINATTETSKASVKVKGKGSYSLDATIYFDIKPCKIMMSDLLLDTYTSSNMLVKEYDGSLSFEENVTPTIRFKKQIDDSNELNIILDYDLSNSKYENVSGRDKDNLGGKSSSERDKRDLIFSDVKLKNSDTNNYVLIDSDGTTALNKFNSVSFDDCGQIIDTTKPVVLSSTKSVLTVGKGGTLRITLNCSEDIVHDFTIPGFDASKLYIELFSKETSESYGKAVINTDSSLTKDNVLVFDYQVPTNDSFNNIRVEGFTIEIKNESSGVLLADDCNNELVLDPLSDTVKNTFNDLVIDTRGVSLNIIAFSDNTFTNEITRDSITNLFDIYYKFTFGSDVTGFDASDIDVTNGTVSDFTKVDNKTYTCKVSNIGKLQGTDTNGIVQTVSVAKDKAQDANSNYNVADTLNLTIKRNLIIKDETLLLSIPGLDTSVKVIIKANDILTKVSYGLYEIFNNVVDNSVNFASNDTLTLTDLTDYSLESLLDKYIIKVNGHKDDYISTEETYTYLIKNIDHIAKEIIDKVLPSLNPSDSDLRDIIKDNDNKEIYELPEDVRDILTNDNTNKVTDAIIVAIKDLIDDKHVDELDDSNIIKDEIAPIIVEIARLSDKIQDITTDAMDYEERMIKYQSLSVYQKEYMNRHYHDEIENLHNKYYELIDSCKSNTIESLDNEDSEVVEVYGVINKLQEGLTDANTEAVRSLSVEKINEEEKLNKINETLENKKDEEGNSLLSDKKVIIPYDIKILLDGSPVENVKTGEKLLIKLKLPKEFFDAVFKIYHLDKDYNFKEEIDLTKQLINDECLIYFFADSFSPYIPVSDLRTIRIESNDNTLGTVDPLGLNAVNVGDNFTISITPNQGYYANVIVNGTKVKDKFNGGNYELTNIQENKDVFVEFVKNEEPQKPTDPEKPSITIATVITIQNANHMPYIDGYSDKTFRPNNNMTRAEFTKVISTISNNFNLSYDNDKYITKYKDVKEDSWYSNYVGYVTKLGLMKGYSDDTFKPNEYITRAEVSKVLSDMFNVPDKQIENIFFNELNGHWYFNSTNELIKGGVIKGYKDGTFKPNNNITRAEVITLINRVKDREIDKDIDKGYLNMMDSKFKDVSKSNWFYNDLLEASIAHNSFDLH